MGTVATWGWDPPTFSAVGTVASTFVAALAALLAVNQVRSARRDKIRAQAGLFTAMITGWERQRGDGTDLVGDISELVVTLHNASDQPIFDLALVVAHKQRDTKGGWQAVLPDFQGRESFSRQLGRKQMQLLRLEPASGLLPKQSATVALRIRVGLLSDSARTSLAISFIDSTDRTWARRLDGHLGSGWQHSVRGAPNMR